jgi:catechol 2,3-dioxygenase-like lactoylglutathione lyase family enzyme
MSITLDHCIVPAHDPIASAELLARLLDVPWEKGGHFTPVHVNEGLTLDFDASEGFQRHHYCFRVDEREFDAIFGRLGAAGIVYRSQPTGPDDMTINTRLGGRNVYWNDANGHIWEILTVSYARPQRATGRQAPA